ncbi:peptidylprolyl isomerase [Nocardia transvalensis]|uniref:peptidylprolyl isomerase n=1 Tax=Nocardia transvalensis TaxID=37333 RepID=UPI0018931149|nr:peptidylprolyl isomerase [Nocardia transvalensis]MBF6332087.1 peptidylprolyl isomerase [Nocardia transvalensis]
MPTNEQRRAAAKRKLERRLARQAERERRRKQLTIAGSVLGVVVAVAAGVGIYYLTRGDDSKNTAATQTPDASLSSTPQAAPPAAPVAKAANVTCTYRDGGEAAKPVQKPSQTEVGTQGQVAVTIDTNQGPIGLTLDNGESPCTVNSFVSLANQHYFDGTPCHRLTTEGIKVLQCGDPSGTGRGGPGYAFDNEYPTDQYPQDAPKPQPVLYKRGVVAMANAGPGTNGSQFFLVYGDSPLPPNYTIFGTIDDAGLQTLDKIAGAGLDDADQAAGDGKPKNPVTFDSVRVG